MTQNSMYRIAIIIVLITFFLACNSDRVNQEMGANILNQKELDSIELLYTVDTSFNKGDARRYGLTPETAARKHLKMPNNYLTAIIDLAEKTGMTISFPKGYYPLNLTLDGRRNVKLHFNHSAFELIHITDRDGKGPRPENIELTGTLISFVRLGITEATNIKIDTILLKSNPEMSKSKLRNRGCHIYHGVKDVSINYLEIDDLGSGNEQYKHTHAALAIDGTHNNPKQININEIYIRSSDRHGIYLTGSDHTIGTITISQFGVGSAEGMSNMQESMPGQEKEFTGVWLNKCTNTTIDQIIIDCEKSNGKFALKFERGSIFKPTIINQLIVKNYKKDLPLDYPPNVIEIGEIIKK